MRLWASSSLWSVRCILNGPTGKRRGLLLACNIRVGRWPRGWSGDHTRGRVGFSLLCGGENRCRSRSLASVGVGGGRRGFHWQAAGFQVQGQKEPAHYLILVKVRGSGTRYPRLGIATVLVSSTSISFEIAFWAVRIQCFWRGTQDRIKVYRTSCTFSCFYTVHQCREWRCNWA
ncbi:hypothetical protein K469DRAFT_344345 [Zopfia rhizophila CBS 207.26]|uniref:Uncharacterized protein n=1 Tax=Zopfia rhizophila CBS 207.26 TaxID=1314779 RepID=A0A6A6EKN2_9PEZI|nr:hypothetical protein K469DRAFT_344345 [Zopfia rhizophila CBS 207.26]